MCALSSTTPRTRIRQGLRWRKGWNGCSFESDVLKWLINTRADAEWAQIEARAAAFAKEQAEALTAVEAKFDALEKRVDEAEAKIKRLEIAAAVFAVVILSLACLD